MESKMELAAPCGMYCGVCGIYVANRDNNIKLKERLKGLFGVTVEQMSCQGCLSDNQFVYCRTCPIRACTIQRGLEGCHQCQDFPCQFIDAVGIPIGRKVMLRSVPARRELGTERWMEEEEKRYHCPHCGYALFRGVSRCRNCQNPVDVD